MNRSVESTKGRLLDAAEGLFARQGYQAASLREITREAGANLAAVNYHFGSKKKLLEAVIRRRVEPLNRERKQRIEAVRDKARQGRSGPSVRDVLEAFIEPTLRFRESSPGACAFFSFIGRSLMDPDDTVRKVFLPFIRPLFQLLFETCCEALPLLSREKVFWRLQLTLGAVFHMIHLCGGSALNQISPAGMKMDTSTDAIINHVVPYVSAGMKVRP